MAIRTGPVFDSEIVDGAPDRIYQLPLSVPPMMAGVLAGTSGVTRGLDVTARTPSALGVDVQPGTAFIDGFFVEVYGSAEQLPIAPGDDAARIDRVVVQLDLQARTVTLDVVQGTAGAGPPALPADTIPLGIVTVPANAIGITRVDDDRRWARAAGVHAGDIKATGRQSSPAGWLPCDGRTLARAEFPDLFAAIGTSYGAGDGYSTFRIPDLRARFPVGTGSGYPMGSTGGEAWVTLGVNHLPTHDHEAGSLQTSPAGDHDHALHFRRWEPTGTDGHDHDSVGDSVAPGTATTGWVPFTATGAVTDASPHTHPITGRTEPRGAGVSHENRPPYQAVRYIIAL